MCWICSFPEWSLFSCGVKNRAKPKNIISAAILYLNFLLRDKFIIVLLKIPDAITPGNVPRPNVNIYIPPETGSPDDDAHNKAE